MRKNYPDLSNTIFIEVLQLRKKLSQWFFILGFLFLSLSSYGQQFNAEIPTPFTSNNFDGLSVSTNVSGVCVGLLGCGIDNKDLLIDSDLTNNATSNFGLLGVGTSHSFKVTDGNTTYASGTFAGFKISAGASILSLNLLNNVVIKTYINNVEQESFSGASLLNLSLLSGAGSDIVGFNTSKPFDAVEIVLNSGLSLLSSTKIYHAVIRQYSAGPALDCNVVTKISLPNYPVIINPANTGMSGISVGSVTNPENAISSSDSDYASINLTVGLLASGSIAIKDQLTDYPAGTYAGFEIENTNLLSVAALGNVVVSTYLNGSLQEQFSGTNLVANVGLLSSGGRFKLGFVSSQAFDEVKLSVNQTLSLNLGTTRVYGAVFQSFCVGPALDCNTKTALATPTFPVYVNNINSGIDGVLCALCTVVNQDNLIDADPNSFAEVNLAVGVGTRGSLSVKEQITDYPAGTFAGYIVENPNLLDVNALGAVRITTYLNGVQQETKTGNGPLVSVGTDLLGGSGRKTIGFVSALAFDEVKITFENVASINLGQVKVYNAVFERFCAGPALDCNTKTALTSPTYPVYVNSENTGVNGVLCALCTVVNQDNLVDTNPNSFAEVNLAVGVGTRGSLSVKEQITDYPAGTFAGYTIENPALLTVGALDAVRITTYLNGVQQETKTGNGPLISVGTDLLVGTGRNTVGFVTTKSFDEVQITFENLASVNLGQVKVYNAVFQRLCNPVVECNENYVLSNPAFPVVINGDRTGINGVAYVACAVKDTDNLLTADQTDFANITLIAGVVGSGSVAVKDQLFTYPKGTFAGYVIKDLGTLAQVNLLQSLTITTYNNGVLQESRTAGQLIDLSLLGIDVLGSTPGVYNVGFKSNLAFDEIRLTLNSLASVINSINVYGAFVDTSETDGGPGSGLECNSSSVTVAKDGTYIDANSDGIVNVGDRVDYTFNITNTGFETLRDITLTDNTATVIGTPIASLAAGANNTTNYTATYNITQADIDAGVVYNLATVNAKTNLGTSITATSTDPTPCTTCPVSPTCVDCTATPITQTNTIALVKTATVAGTGVLGDVITYTFSVTNTGTTTLKNVVVTDPLAGLVISGSPITTLAAGTTNTTIKGTYIIKQIDVDAGKVTNSALVTAKDPQNNNVTDISGTTITTDDSTVVPVNQTNTIALVKTGSVTGAGGLGETITYTFAVHNTGITTLHDVVVTDLMGGLDFVSGNSIATLAPGATDLSITATYNIAQADVNAGKVTNSAEVNAKDPQNNNIKDISGTTIITDDPTVTPIGQRSTIALVKKAVVGGTGGLGETITYTFEVHNTGTTDLKNITITDPLIGLDNTNNLIAALAPGAVDATITRTYIITQADVDAGKVTNSAVVNGLDSLDNPVTDISGTTVGTNDSTVTPVTQNSSITLVKTAVAVSGGIRVLGDVIDYTFAVKNTGTTTLKNIVVSDPLVGLTLTGNPIASLAPGVTDNISIKGAYVITQADVDAGQVTNSALVIAKDPQNISVTDISGTTETNDDPIVTPVTQTSTIALVKTGVYNGDPTEAKVGDTVTYTFRVTNTGTTTLKNIIVNDPKIGLTLTGNSIASLAPGVTDNTSFKGTYTIIQADIDAGRVTNTATVKAQDPQGVDVSDKSGTAVDNDDDTVTTLPKSGSLAFVKEGVYNGDATKAKVGDKITYTFTVTNTGNVKVDNIVINDAKLGVANLALVPSSLAPLATGVVKQDYTITQTDIDSGIVTNSAIALGQDPQGVNVQDISGTTVDNDDSTETNVPKSGSLAFIKTGTYIGNPIQAVAGDIINYTFTVINTGNVAVNNIVINDTKLGVTNLALVPSSLAPLATGVATKSYVVTQADVDAGIVVNTAVAKGQDPKGINVQDISGTAVDNDNSTETALPNPSRQQCNAEVPIPFVSANFDDLSVSKSTFTSGIGVCVGCNISNEANLINSNLNDYATASFGALNVGFNHSLRVTDGNTTYAAGTFAGFKIGPSGGLLSLDLLNGVTINTYNDGNLIETFSGSSLLSLNLLSGPSQHIVGFNTAQTFDAVEIVLNGGVALLSSTNIYHAVIRQYCAGPALDCNTSTKLSLPTYPVAISQANTGMSGIAVGSVSNVENAISSNDSDYASINLTVGLLASGSIAIKDQVADYPIGTYAGFEIENTNLLSVAALGNVVVSTYLNGSLQEQFSGTNLVANVGLLSSGGRFKLGFVSSKVFDEVKLSVNQTVGLNLGTTRVYGAVVQKFCAGPALACNVQTAVSTPTYPVYVNSVNSGINGVACVGCAIVNQDNLIDADLNSFAEVNLAVGVGTRGSLSVKEQITDYPAGTFAGYTIENPALLTVGALDAVRITTYLNGVQQETKTGNGALVSVGTDLLVGTGRNTVGFVSTTAFDEVQITFENLASVNLGQIKVYNAVFQRLCDPVVECNENYVLSNPAFPVTINNDNTGIDGVACVACAVNNTNNLLTADQTDFANITVIAGVLGSGSVAVKDHLFTYPKGTFAGYLIKDLGTLAQVNLLQSLTITTYNNGVLQEARSAGQLIDLSLLGIDILGSTPGLYNVGFKTSLPFDEIKLTLSSLASVINSIDVYGAFVNTSESDGGPGSGLECNSSSISLTKDGIYVDANSDGIVNVGDRIDYTFDIKNTGFETLTNVTLTDDTAVVSGTPIASLTAGSNNATSYTATYNITQADIDAGVVYNLATVSATTNIGTNITATSTDPTPCATCPVNPACTDCTATELIQDPKLAFVKTGVYNGDPNKAQVGDKITYTFTVTNTGNVTVKDIVISDAKLGVTNLGLVPSSLAPLGTGVITSEYAITQADIDLGSVTNTAIAIGQDPRGVNVQDTSGTAVNNDDNTVTTLPKSAAIAFVKTGVYNGDASNAKVGDKITYTFTVTNTGNVTVKDIVISDAKLGVTSLALVPDTLAPTATGVITQDYTITQADIDAKKVTNTATATGQDPQGVDVTDKSGTAVGNDTETVIDLPTTAAIAFVKTGVYNGDASNAKVGDKITYTFTVTNTGNVTVKDIVISDAKLGVTSLALAPGTLAPSETGVITQDYTITQADIDAKKVTNTATATGQDPQGVDVTDKSGTAVGNDTETVIDLPTTAAIAFVKTGVYNGDASNAKVGDKITYTFTVTNTGNVTVKDIVISDAKLGITSLALVPGTLAPSATGVVTREYTITQADIDAKKVTNTAIAIGQDPQGVDVTDKSGTAVGNDTETVIDLPATGSLAFVKTGVYNGDATKAKVGDKITYTFTVTNTGNVTVKDIVISDAKLGVTSLALVPGTLAPSATGVVTREYTITQADIDAKKVTNTAIAIGQDPQGVDVTDKSGTAVGNDTETVIDLPAIGSLAFVKTGVYNGDATKAKVGDKITYTFTVTNTGNVTVSNIVINDAKLGATSLGLVPSSLAPLATGVITREYTITQADIDLGSVTNTAIAIGQDPQGVNVQDISGTAVDNDDSTVTTLPKSGSLAFVKTGVYNGDPNKAQVGDKITYTFTVTNTGNVTVSNIVVNDAKLEATSLALVPSTLAPLATGVITRDYTITQADIDIRKVTNSAIAIGQDPQGADVQDISGTAVDNDDPTVTDLPENAKIALILKGEFQDENQDGLAQIGETIKYKYTVMNMGEVPLSDVWIEDVMVGHGMSEGLISLAVGGVDDTTFSSTYTLTQADIIQGNVSNQATAYGTSPLGKIVQDLSHDTSPLEDGFTVIDVDGCQLTIFNAVSPNSGSEYERILYIRGLDCYPDNTVQIFDRWGVKVYEVNGYDNNTKAFRGISEGRVTVNQSKGLADGTYFYIINYVDRDGKGNNKSGYLHLIND